MMTYQINRYPVELVDVVHLSERVVIRPVLPQDRELMSAFFDDLAADARCNRFMHPVREPSSELLRQFTEVDYANHVALVAEVFAPNAAVCVFSIFSLGSMSGFPTTNLSVVHTSR